MPATSSKPKGLPGAQVAKVLELVNYQDGAFVSREIVKKPAGSVTYAPAGIQEMLMQSRF